ncbi:RNA-directed DNA polymerase, eukaryota [Tanacetum coccineum]
MFQKDSIICADNYVAAQVMGDFNEVREAADWSGFVFNERHAEIFNSFITNMNLFDVPLGGFRFTWIDKWASKMSKLDRFLATEGFHDTFPNITGIILEKGIPDHRPILLKEYVVDYGPTPFCFFHSWLECEGFYDLVVDTWKSYDSGDTNGMISFKKNLQNLKQVIRSASSDDLTLRISYLKILGDIELKEASDLAQKAKVKWALEGDENTSFFHGSLKKKRCESAIKGILKNGVWIDDPGENSRASILINGSPTPELDMFNGLRQGDPMSPFLFILAMEGLHALVSKAVATGLFKGASIGRGVNVLDEEVSSMALVLGCGVAKLPMMYLGVPIGCNMGRCDNWKRVVQKFESKMNRWKAKLLSVGGRLSLIKVVLGNLPTYYMSLYSMPITVQKRLESIRNRFFIGGDSDDKKITWVKWNSCLASKAMGGLGIGSTFALNVALLFKWIWSPWNSKIRTVSHLQAKGIDLLALCGRSLGMGIRSAIGVINDVGHAR